MNVHFFVTYSKDASNSVFAQELKKQDIDFTIFSENISLRYKYRLWLYFVGWPRILLFAFCQAWRSLQSKPKPDWIVAGSHFEALAVITLAKLFRNHKPKIMLLGFIYTNRRSHLLTKLKYWYFSKILNRVDCVICHSVQEVEKNTSHFVLKNTQFVFVPFGLHLALPAQSMEEEKKKEPYALSAGRSGRDYDVLIRCFSQLEYQLHIICDSNTIIDYEPLPSNIQVFRQCYGNRYFKELANAKLVVIPLSVNDISAGQMVLLQAMALKKPIIITETNTISHYVAHEKTVLLVEKGDLYQMKTAVQYLWNNENFANELSKNAKNSFEENYSMTAYTGNIIQVLKQMNKR